MYIDRETVKNILLHIMKLIKMKEGRKGERKRGNYIWQNLLLSFIKSFMLFEVLFS